MESQLIDQLISRFANKYPYKEEPAPLPSITKTQGTIQENTQHLPQYPQPQQPNQPHYPQSTQPQSTQPQQHTVQINPPTSSITTESDSFKDTLDQITKQIQMEEPKKSFFSSSNLLFLLKIFLIIVAIICCYYLFWKRK